MASRLLAFVAAVLVFPCICTAQTNGPIAQTSSGYVLGTSTGSSTSFLGIPYAHPPTGSYRWDSPMEAVAWFPEVYPALSEGPGCPQMCNLPAGLCPTSTSEDCLFANVFTPAAPSKVAAGYPVIVFIHGGGFNAGHGGGSMHNPANFVNHTGVIVVTFNYRLGALGTLKTEWGTYGGNLGLQDQVFMLKWVRDNIRHFGGDPSLVTLWGEDSGALSVAAHMADSSVWSLFHRAILSSNPLGLSLRNASEAELLYTTFSQETHCAARDKQCMIDLPVSQILTAQHAAAQAVFAQNDVLERMMPFSPVVGIGHLTRQPLDSWLSGTVAKVPTLLGEVSNGSTILVYGQLRSPVSAGFASDILSVAFGNVNVDAIEALYPSHNSSDARVELSQILDDALFTCPNLNSSSEMVHRTGNDQVFTYQFAHPWSFKQVWGQGYSYCADLACMGAELPFVFQPDVYGDFNQDERALSQDLIEAWANFARTGTPSADGLPAWKPATADSVPTMVFETPASTVKDTVASGRCHLWDQLRYVA